MTFKMGTQIRKMRKAYNLTQENFARMSGISLMSLRRYETDERQPTMATIEKMASALKLTVGDFLWKEPITEESYWWTEYLENKLKSVDCSLGHNEEDSVIWINYPDGTLEVEEKELKELNQNVDNYIKFQLEELKKKHLNNFRHK